LAPAFDQDVRQGLLIDLVFWGRAAVGRAATKALAVAKAAIRFSLEIDEECPGEPKRGRCSRTVNDSVQFYNTQSTDHY
jgi:hypothetical protein